jgi:hypothetical protein
MAAPTNPADATDQLLTVDEVASRLRTTPAAVYSSRYRGQPPGSLAMTSGRRLLFDWAEVVGWLQRSRSSAMSR